MTPREELNEIFLEWHTLSEAEHEAIKAFDWTRLADHQQQKAGLQGRIRSIEHRINTASADPTAAAAMHQNHFRDILEELVRLETENRGQLEAHLAASQHQRNELRQTSQNLRRLHRAYVADSDGAWHSYS
jgi:predicted  nucleic acid-binding Zn-ribbon protein